MARKVKAEQAGQPYVPSKTKKKKSKKGTKAKSKKGAEVTIGAEGTASAGSSDGSTSVGAKRGGEL